MNNTSEKTVQPLNNDSRVSTKKLPLSTTLYGWVISNDEDFEQPLMEYLSQWPNAKFTAITELEYKIAFNNLKQFPSPDIIIADSNLNWEKLSKDVVENFSADLPIILISHQSDATLLRKAIRNNIKDVLTIPFDESEIDSILDECAKSKRIRRGQGKLSVFINAKGGMGASIITTTIAHMMALDNLTTCLVDTDAQFGSISNLLSTPPKYILSDALSQVETLDEYALNGMLTKHSSGLRFITSRSEHVFDNINEVQPKLFSDFIAQAKNNFNHVIVDMSRGMENSTLPAISEANYIFIVVQQNIPSIREASSLIKRIKHLFGNSDQQIKVIVNRFSKNVDISQSDIIKSLRVEDIIVIPNDYQSVSSSTNLGELLATNFENKPITKSLRNVSNIIYEKEINHITGFKKLLAYFRR
ncbi:AAA family ATPase [Photobacterium sp. BZF1]|uniref:AAA family ATPase n=1 Tax=Photobacterium sp. BZF1 TaxID=1904457 RepID=UPI001653E574|nr:AAA family ATPase [Photobacterium sp. BZF1]MBC7002826.1 AAA family ATPase [Photobacterium sp. BZF1]